VDVDVEGDDSQEGPTDVSNQDFPRCTGLLGSEEYHMIVMAPCPYRGLY
jgi:hypothetical protein